MSFTRSLSTETRAQDKILGLFVLGAVAIGVYLVLQQTYFHTKKQHWVTLQSVLSDSFGVVPGTLVELSGVTIGNVESVELKPDATVHVTIIIDDQYISLLATDSVLEVNSQLGLDSVLSGTALTLVPGSSLEKMQTGDRITIREPKSLEQLLQQYKQDYRLDEIAEQLRSTIEHINQITGTFAQEKESMAETLRHVAILSQQLTVIGGDIPALLQRVDATLQTVQNSLVNMDTQLQAVVVPANETLSSSRQLMGTMDETIIKLQPTLERVPELLATTNQTLLSVNDLMHKLSQHWLLGGQADQRFEPVRLELLADDALYQDGK